MFSNLNVLKALNVVCETKYLKFDVTFNNKNLAHLLDIIEMFQKVYSAAKNSKLLNELDDAPINSKIIVESNLYHLFLQ